jgi:predicted PurR-regulated permease PerM
LLSDSRRIKAALLRAAHHSYRRDVRALWDAFGQTLSRFLGGLMLTATTEGLLAAIALAFLGVPYAFVLGAWVSVTAIIPYVGALLGYAPALLLALSISPTTALAALLLCLLINLLVGNVLAPRIQGQAVRVHPVLVFVATVIGGELFGLPGIVLAVPAMALLRVLFDFFRVRVRVAGDGPTSRQQIGEPRADGRHAPVVPQGAGVTPLRPNARARGDE